MNINLLPRQSLWERWRSFVLLTAMATLLSVSAVATTVIIIDQSRLRTTQQTLTWMLDQQSSLQKEQTILNSKLQSYATNILQEQSVGPQWLIQSVISEFMSSLPPGAQINSLSYNGNSLMILGTASNLLEIAQFESKLTIINSVQSVFIQSLSSIQANHFSFTMAVQLKGAAKSLP